MERFEFCLLTFGSDNVPEGKSKTARRWRSGMNWNCQIVAAATSRACWRVLNFMFGRHGNPRWKFPPYITWSHFSGTMPAHSYPRLSLFLDHFLGFLDC